MRIWHLPKRARNTTAVAMDAKEETESNSIINASYYSNNRHIPLQWSCWQ